MKRLLLAALVPALLVVNADVLAQAKPAPKATATAVADPALQAAVASSTRDPKNVLRDQYRHPAQTLAFFGVKPDQTVVEITPGGGWYTEILAPFLAAKGKLIVAGPDTNGSEGNVDHPQWRWLEGELEAAERRDELVLVFAHHPIQTMTNDFADELSPCGGTDAHGHGTVPSCDSDPRSSTPLHLGDDLTKLFLDHRNVVAFVAGHAHRDKVTLSVTSPENGAAAEEVPGDYAAQPFEIGFNSRYLMDILGQIEGDNCEVHLADAAAPTLIRENDKSPALYVLMPMRV